MKSSLDILRSFINKREKRGATMEAVINRMKDDNILLANFSNCSECKLHNRMKRIDDEDELRMAKLDTKLQSDTEDEMDVEDFVSETMKTNKMLNRDSEELLAGGALMDMYYLGEVPEKVRNPALILTYKEPANIIHVAPPPVYEEPPRKKKPVKKAPVKKTSKPKSRPSTRIALKENSTINITAVIEADTVIVNSTTIEKTTPEKSSEETGDNPITISDDESPSAKDLQLDPTLPPVAVPVSENELSPAEDQNDSDEESPPSKKRKNSVVSRYFSH